MADSSPTPRPDPRRESLLHDAAGLLARNPHASTTEIAAACRISRATLHRHFPRREILVAELLDRADRAVLDAATRADLERGDHLEALRRLIDEFEARSPFTTLLYALSKEGEEEVDSPAWAEADRRIVAFFEDGKRAHAFTPHITARWMAEAFYALTAAGEWAMSSGKSARRETPTLVHGLLLHGIGAAGTD